VVPKVAASVETCWGPEPGTDGLEPGGRVNVVDLTLGPVLEVSESELSDEEDESEDVVDEVEASEVEESSEESLELVDGIFAVMIFFLICC